MLAARVARAFGVPDASTLQYLNALRSLSRSKHELVFVYKVGTAPHVNHVELGAKGRHRTNVWDYPGVNSFSGWPSSASF